MKQPAHKTDGLNRTKTVCFYPYVSTGKEKDEETGYGYFGARYMDHELMTMWLSVDPMADKYPSISPYAYCAWNPVKLVDPDGKDVWSVSEDGHIKKIGDDGGAKKQTIKYANGETALFDGAYYQSILRDLSTSDNKISYSRGTYNKKTAMGELFLSLADNTNVEWDIQKYKGGRYVISTLHHRSRSPSPCNMGMEMSDLITTIHSHPAAMANLKDEIGSMGFVTSDGTRETCRGSYDVSDFKTRERYPDNSDYYIYMRNSHNIYLLNSKDGVVYWPVKTGIIKKASQLPW